MGDHRRELEAFCADAYAPLVRAVALHCGSRQLAEDVVQEALLRACVRWRTVRRLQSPFGWSFRVATNLAASHYRRRSAEERAYKRSSSGHVASAGPDDVETHQLLHSALLALPVRQRQAVVLRYLVDLTPAETAEALGLSVGAVRTLTHRAMTRLREPAALHDLAPTNLEALSAD